MARNGKFWLYMAIAVLVVIWGWREKSWSKLLLEKDKELQLLRLQLEELVSMMPDEAPMLDLELMDRRNRLSEGILFDFEGLIQFILLTVAFQCEYYALYQFKDKQKHGISIDPAVFTNVRLFMARHNPVCTTAVYMIMWLISCISWLGLGLKRDYIVTYWIKFILLYAGSSLLSFLMINFSGIIAYLPKNSEDWKKAMTSSSWWLWFTNRIFGVHDILSAVSVLLWSASWILMLWPLRYFFYYRNTVYDVDKIQEYHHVFFLNNLGHLSLIFFILYFVMNVVVTLPVLEGSIYEKTQSVPSLVLSKLKRILRAGYSQNFLAIMTITIVLNFALHFVRTLYFQWGTTGTWYSWMLVWTLLIGHVVTLLTLVPYCNLLLQRNTANKALRPKFARKFIAVAIEKAKEGYKREGCDDSDEHSRIMESVKRDTEEIANEIFDRILDKSLVFCLFSHIAQEDGVAQGMFSEEDEEEHGKLGGKFVNVLQAMMQTEAFAYKSRDPSEENHHTEDNNNYSFDFNDEDGSGQKEPRTDE